MKTYDELLKFQTFDERFEYLNLQGVIGEDTFGYSRFLNQNLYTSEEWRRTRREIILRDMGCDMGLTGHDICGGVIVHHINPITPADILNRSPKVLDPNNLICVSKDTHNAIHYGNLQTLTTNELVERRPGDTCPCK